MGSPTSRITSNASLAYVEHDSANSNETWQLILTAVTSANGAADGTTLVDTLRPSGSADTYNGRYWVRLMSGSNKGLWRRIIDDDGAGTVTLEGAEGLPAQVAGNVNYQLWLSPEPVVVLTGATNATTFADTERNEDDDFWEGYFLEVISGTYLGEKARCSDFANSTGTFTVGSGLSGTPSAGDVMVLRRYIDVNSVNDGLTQAFNERPMHRLDGSMGDGSVGPKAGTFGFETPCQGVFRLGANTYNTVLGGLLVACGMKRVDSNVAGGATTPAASTTTQLEVDTGTWEDYSIGSGISVNGEQAFITALGDGGGTDDNITVTPALGSAPAAGATIPRTISYRRNRRNDDGDYGSVTIIREVDGVRTTMTGCKGNLTISGETELNFGFEFNVDHFIREYAPNPCYQGDSYLGVEYIQSIERRCYFGSTAVELGGISVTLGNEVAARTVQGSCGINGRAGHGHVTVMPTATCRKLMETTSTEEIDHDQKWFGRTTHDLMIFWGNKLYGGCAVRMAVAKMVEEPKPEDASGMQDTPYVLQGKEAGTTTDPDNTVVKIPDFVISFS